MKFKERKHPRLKDYDYSLPGYYYVTIHNQTGAPMLSLIRQGHLPGEAMSVLTLAGKLAQRQLVDLENRFDYVTIDKYVIMPTHIHAIIILREGPRPRPSLMEIVRAYKSLTTRLWNQTMGTQGEKLFQTSFYDRVIRNQHAYEECWNYIEGNPGKWLTDPEDL